jgi:hypothetical protein
MGARIELNHLPIGQGIAAGTAFRPLGQLDQGNPVHLATGGTGKLDGIAHRASSNRIQYWAYIVMQPARIKGGRATA